MFYDFIFPQYCRGRVISLLILALRVFFGILFFTHGLDKMINFNELSYSFPSIFGLGSYMSLMIAIFTEFACSLFLISGLLVRITVIPMIAAMAVAFFDLSCTFCHPIYYRPWKVLDRLSYRYEIPKGKK